MMLTSLKLLKMVQGILVSGIGYYMQVWVIDKSGPVFLAMTMPITLLVTIVLSSFLGEAVTLGRCLVSFCFPIYYCLKFSANNDECFTTFNQKFIVNSVVS
jgi:hypothetical protein